MRGERLASKGRRALARATEMNLPSFGSRDASFFPSLPFCRISASSLSLPFTPSRPSLSFSPSHPSPLAFSLSLCRWVDRYLGRRFWQYGPRPPRPPFCTAPPPFHRNATSRRIHQGFTQISILVRVSSCATRFFFCPHSRDSRQVINLLCQRDLTIIILNEL